MRLAKFVPRSPFMSLNAKLLNTKNKPQKSQLRKKEKLQLALLMFASLLVFFFKLDATLLTNWDEAWHAVIARNMARTGDFITPVYNGQIWFATAPLYLWLVASWFTVFGITTLGVRIFSALAAVGGVYLTYRIGKLLFSHTAGLFAGLVLTTTVQYLYRGRTGNLDTMLTFFVSLAVFAFLAARKDSRWYLITGASTALAFLTKGILGLLPMPLFLLVPRRYVTWSFVAFLLVFLPWHLVAYLRHGEGFFTYFFLKYMLSKANVPNPVSGTETFWYVTVLRHGLKLWFAALPFALIIVLKDSMKKKNLWLPVLWAIGPFIMLTIARMRNDWYLIPIYPGIALLIGYFAAEIAATGKLKALVTAGLIGIAAFNILWYRGSIFVPETVAAEASLAQIARERTSTDETILLDDNYLPVAAFYADRKIVPLRYSREKESLVSDALLREATGGAQRKLVLTNTQTLDQLIEAFHGPTYERISERDDKLLIELRFE